MQPTMINMSLLSNFQPAFIHSSQFFSDYMGLKYETQGQGAIIQDPAPQTLTLSKAWELHLGLSFPI